MHSIHSTATARFISTIPHCKFDHHSPRLPISVFACSSAHVSMYVYIHVLSHVYSGFGLGCIQGRTKPVAILCLCPGNILIRPHGRLRGETHRPFPPPPTFSHCEPITLQLLSLPSLESCTHPCPPDGKDANSTQKRRVQRSMHQAGPCRWPISLTSHVMCRHQSFLLFWTMSNNFVHIYG